MGAVCVLIEFLLAKAFPFPQYSLGHDLWIGLIAIKFGLVYFCPEVLVEYRRHSTTVTSTGSKSKNSFGFKIRYRIMLLIEYLKLYKKMKKNCTCFSSSQNGRFSKILPYASLKNRGYEKFVLVSECEDVDFFEQQAEFIKILNQLMSMLFGVRILREILVNLM